jgi:hypothetical protein
LFQPLHQDADYGTVVRRHDHDTLRARIGDVQESSAIEREPRGCNEYARLTDDRALTAIAPAYEKSAGICRVDLARDVDREARQRCTSGGWNGRSQLQNMPCIVV